MSGLPRGWVETTLGEIGEWSSGGTPSRARPDYYGGDIPWVKTGDLEDRVLLDTPEKITQAGLRNSSAKLFPSGTLLIAMYGATIGKTALLGISAATNQACAAFVPSYHSKELVPFLWKFALANKPRFIAAGQGGAQPNISQTLIKQFPINIPPLAEQRRIVAKLDALNANSSRACIELARIKTLVSRYKQAVLSKEFSGELARKDLGDLVACIKAGKNLRCEERPPLSYENGVVKVSAVTWGEFRPDQSKTLPPDFEPDPGTRIRSGDFLFSRANTIELVGAVVIVAEAPDNLYLSDKILRLEFNEPIDAWLLWYLRSPMGREALMNISSGNQLSMRNIGQKSLLSLSIPYADAKLRTEIVHRIEAAFTKIDRLSAEAKRALELVGKLDEAILAKAFRGELIHQDENDEPAEKLLERIRVERAAAPKAKRGRSSER
ncbi:MULTISPECIES: restriction endonuclease subunit S [Rhizobium]|uniref:restriction endonuclease subunit S n=1 Tax=Rhizobium TaxID=379 RepID=UPI0007EA4FFD|nr:MULTISPECIES: restriction endonuclease subunit S [Rhizobium]ANK90550.1 type 1 restriction-modification system protein HsdS [Rhizobium sp. N6212]ANK96578.1 type 1 restriction-modification system protein HsdS [Rhizobium sp. N621]ANL02622.1 type 1 restriction-modification system protein HsdS [Rhizobium esperanzae]ANL08750.1 type 1 restriction-modification system protein HsdS [Rhizobium sp. N1341]ANL20797.1 type 1 restriction-modification system protein HsdS [Rhizobium sp. N113]